MIQYIKQRGIALIELLIYMSILVLVCGALIMTFLSYDSTLVRNRTERALADEARTALDRISQSIRDANTVNTGQSTLNVSPGALAVVSSATTTRFSVSSGALMLAVNGVDNGALTSDAVTVQSVVFNHFVGSSTDLVRVALTLSAVSKAASSTRTFYTSAVLRETYE